MNAFLESELQSYVENHIERDFNKWVPHSMPFRLLGAQVQCAFGYMDILGACNHRPVIVELKAEVATEKVVGQVLRYQAAVKDTFESQVVDLCLQDTDTDFELGDLKPICVVIAPDYHDNAVAGLGRFAWLLKAHRLDDGSFSIVYHTRGVRHFAREQPKLAHLLKSVSAEYFGYRVGATMVYKHQRLLRDSLPHEK